MLPNEATTAEPLRWIRFGVLFTVTVCIGLAFYVLECQRSQELLRQAVEIRESLEGHPYSATFSEGHVTEEQLRRARSFPQLKSVVLAGTQSIAGDVSWYQSFPQLKWVDLTAAAWVDQRTLRDIASLEQLEVLGLCHTTITDTALAELVGHPSVQRLFLDGCDRVTDASVGLIAGLPALAAVDVAGTGITVEGFRRLRVARRDLRIDCPTWLMDSDIRLTEECDRSRSLSSSATAERFARLFEIPHDWITGCSTFEPLKRVRRLELSGADAVAAARVLAPHLVELNRVTAPAAVLSELPETRLHNLESARLYEVTSADQLRRLEEMRSLRSLLLEVTSPVSTDQLVQQLDGLDSLSNVQLRGAGVTDALVASFGQLPSLGVVSVEDAPVSDDAFETLLERSEQFHIRQQNTQISPRMEQRLAARGQRQSLRWRQELRERIGRLSTQLE